MHRKPLIALASAALMAAGGVAIAQQGSPAASPRVAVDANKDGVITRAEAAAHPRLAQRFDQLDKNRDGRLTADERPMTGRGKQAKQRGAGWMGLDADKDGRVSRAEAAARPQLAQRFAEMDADKNDYLDKGDFQARRSARRAEFFAKADTDRNGQLSRAEFDKLHEACGKGKRAAGRGQRPL